jgi:hypothetical protein
VEALVTVAEIVPALEMQADIRQLKVITEVDLDLIPLLTAVVVAVELPLSELLVETYLATVEPALLIRQAQA